jgi:hypothetical protein
MSSIAGSDRDHELALPMQTKVQCGGIQIQSGGGPGK